MSIAGKVIFVSDVRGSFGVGIVEALLRAGANVSCGLEPGLTKPEVSSEIRIISHRSADAGSWEAALAAVAAWGGQIDGLVNNPDRLIQGSIEDASTSDWTEANTAMMDAVWLGVRHGLPKLRDRAGTSVVNIASVASEIGLQNYATYGANAFAIRSMTRSAAIHCLEKGYPVRVNCLVAGFPAGEELAKLVPLAAVTGEQVGAMTVQLCSGAATGMTGAEIFVDGGGSVWPT